ncbi:MAG TPA: YciI family protein [Pyrinomonadaceae bacterium]|nr:YciI family protein [Pyrinomonadaceae bacterium]
MKYLLLIYQNEQSWSGLTEKERRDIYAEYGKFSEEIKASGHYVGGSELHPAATATSVRVRNGKALTTDGPFAETKEQLGGYYLVEAKNLDEAIGLAARIPSARTGTIEVRPLAEGTASATA